jgi:hypothetical protein
MVARTTALVVGLRPHVTRGGQSACLPNRAVVQQRPAAGRKVAPGTRVVLIINTKVGECGLDLPPVSKDLRRVADLFTAFARHPHEPRLGLPVDTSVELFVGGELQKVIPAAESTERRQWETCPGGVGYAARSCPISPLIPFEFYPGPIAATSQAPAHACVPAWELPERLDAYRSVTLTPDESRDCTSYFAVQLFVNDVGQIVAVNLVLSEP